MYYVCTMNLTKTDTMKTLKITTVEEMSANLPKGIRELFIETYKRFVLNGISNGFTPAQANRIVFDLLIKEDLFYKTLKTL
jgi:hypothetical protein